MTYDKVILGIDPGTNVMGYALLGVCGKHPELIVMGVLKQGIKDNPYVRLKHIHDKVDSLVAQYRPDEMAVEAPFFGKNVQSMLKLGRAQGVAIAAALAREIPVHEYAPRSVKMAVTGSGGASKERVANMLKHLLHIPDDKMPAMSDATDALAVALTHFYESGKPKMAKGPSSWEQFVAQNPDRVKK